jgi:hypothetical protein
MIIEYINQISGLITIKYISTRNSFMEAANVDK